MTFQIPDRFMLRGEEYVVVWQQGDVPAPWALGVRKRLRCPTSCIRGWHAVWASEGEGVVLRDLFVYPDGDPPDIRGVAAAREPDGSRWVYRGVDVPYDIDARFVLGRGYVHGDFGGRISESPCVFETVVELVFRRGGRAFERDHSAAVQAIRDRVNGLRAIEIPPGWGSDSRRAFADLEWSFMTRTERPTPMDASKGGRARVMMPGIPRARRAPQREAWELPLMLLVVGDFTQRPDPRPIEDRKPIRVESFLKVMSEFKLRLSFLVPNGPGEQLAVDLRFRDLHDMTRAAIAGKVLHELCNKIGVEIGIESKRPLRAQIERVARDPALRGRLLDELGAAPAAHRAASGVEPGDASYEGGHLLAALVSPEHEGAAVDEALGALIAEIEPRLWAPVQAILDDPRLRGIEAAWRRLRAITEAIRGRAGVEVHLLNASKADLAADYEDAAHPWKSGLFKTLYTAEYGGPGGQPYGAVLSDEPFSASAADLQLLRSVLQTAEPAHVPVVVRPTAELAASHALRALRATEEGRYLGLGDPEIVAPALGASFAERGFCGGVDGVEPLLWVAARVAHCLKVLHRYWAWKMAVPSESEAFLQAWLATLAADPDDGVRPFRAARLRVAGDHDGYYVPFDLSLDAYGDGASPAGSVVIRGWLDKE